MHDYYDGEHVYQLETNGGSIDSIGRSISSETVNPTEIDYRDWLDFGGVTGGAKVRAFRRHGLITSACRGGSPHDTRPTYHHTQ
jgi:hypothetical protein